MSNQLKANPFTVDVAAATVLFPTFIKILHIEFVDYTGDADTCEVQNQRGVTIWKGNGTSDLQPVRSGHIGWCDGLIVPTISAGKVRIYFQ